MIVKCKTYVNLFCLTLLILQVSFTRSLPILKVVSEEKNNMSFIERSLNDSFESDGILDENSFVDGTLTDSEKEDKLAKTEKPVAVDTNKVEEKKPETLEVKPVVQQLPTQALPQLQQPQQFMMPQQAFFMPYQMPFPPVNYYSALPMVNNYNIGPQMNYTPNRHIMKKSDTSNNQPEAKPSQLAEEKPKEAAEEKADAPVTPSKNKLKKKNKSKDSSIAIDEIKHKKSRNSISKLLQDFEKKSMKVSLMTRNSVNSIKNAFNDLDKRVSLQGLKLDYKLDSINKKLVEQLQLGLIQLSNHLREDVDKLKLKLTRMSLRIDEIKAKLPNPDSICSRLLSCGSCTSNPACGWCSVTQTCVEGNENGPTNGACSFYDYKQCSGPKDCSSYNSCDTCIKDVSCGWCNDFSKVPVCMDKNDAENGECNKEKFIHQWHDLNSCPLVNQSNFKDFVIEELSKAKDTSVDDIKEDMKVLELDPETRKNYEEELKILEEERLKTQVKFDKDIQKLKRIAKHLKTLCNDDGKFDFMKIDPEQRKKLFFEQSRAVFQILRDYLSKNGGISDDNHQEEKLARKRMKGKLQRRFGFRNETNTNITYSEGNKDETELNAKGVHDDVILGDDGENSSSGSKNTNVDEEHPNEKNTVETKTPEVNQVDQIKSQKVAQPEEVKALNQEIIKTAEADQKKTITDKNQAPEPEPTNEIVKEEKKFVNDASKEEKKDEGVDVKPNSTNIKEEPVKNEVGSKQKEQVNTETPASSAESKSNNIKPNESSELEQSKPPVNDKNEQPKAIEPVKSENNAPPIKEESNSLKQENKEQKEKEVVKDNKKEVKEKPKSELENKKAAFLQLSKLQPEKASEESLGSLAFFSRLF